MHWDNARYFLAIARAGTLRAAARALNVDQATVGRRLAALERTLDARLFLRTPTAYVLTPAGEALRTPAEAMERAAIQMEQRVMGLDRRLTGTVRVATTDALGKRFVLPAIARLREEHPGIEVSCLMSQDVANLSRRQADLAVRTARPGAPDQIVRRLATLQTGLYASRAYLRSRDVPVSGSGMAGHDLIGSIQGEAPTAFCGESIANGRIVLKVSTTIALVDAAAQGLGIAELPCYRADAEADLVRLIPERADDFDVWLVSHADLHRTARVQALISKLVAEFETASGR
ncbi:LysR family transcriptional regulator [Pseudoxanthomonas winnipegensis]|uniref:LysR family transcriptional regulator n=1 Tax=Pseudoxanthomonas winnipegensis TaxID=2480810 RepID=A0A4Q8M4A1_9GAMM|nr:LysR family transcriptional regulator [Pseudoxanthomonas winnipegensis]TAA40769.1 LysR family transcriptional regulator [Pseudoxanthomonas winnipegensis]